MYEYILRFIQIWDQRYSCNVSLTGSIELITGRSLPDGGVSSSYNTLNERRNPKSDQLNYHPGSWRNGTGPNSTEGGNGFHQTGPSGTTRG